jgi:hypothetical protein
LALKYTTEEAIMRLLEGRLELVQSAFGRTPINVELLDQVAVQAEATLDNVLLRVYKLPLAGTHPTLAEFVELRCVCRLIPVYYQGKDASDDRGIGNSACGEAEVILARLEAKEIKLPGEVPVPDVPVGLRRQTTIVRPYNPSTVEDVGFRQNSRRFSERDR